MSKSVVKIVRVGIALSLIGVIAVGCGRKGELDRPSTPLEQQNIRKTGTPNAAKKDPVPERPFVLDPLL